MKNTVYKVIVCRNSGEEPYYIQVDESGEFDNESFLYDEFNANEDSKMSPSLYMLLNNENCVLSLERVLEPSKKILSLITDEHKYNISNIKLYSSCAECNKDGYSLTTEDGTVFYPSDIDSFKEYEGKVIKVKIEDEILCVKVNVYKYNTKDHIDNVEIIDGCYKTFEDCSKVNEPTETNICTGRSVSPDVLTKSCCKC